MFGRRLFGILFIILIVVGLVSVGGFLGYTQGFEAGTFAAGNADGGTVIVPRPFYGYGYAPFFPLFFGFGLFFKFAFFLLFFFLIAKLFRFWMWRTTGGPPGRWGRHWRQHGPPPWYRHYSDAPDEESYFDSDDAPRTA